MSNIVDPLVGQIAARVRTERERRRWTLAQLPTAVVLGKLSAAFQLSVASLLALAEGQRDLPDAPEGQRDIGDAAAGERDIADAGQRDIADVAERQQKDRANTAGVRRSTEVAEWRDPGTGYLRRQISGPHFPVPYPAAAFAFVRQVVWVLDGRLTFHDGDTVHELDAGDTIELGEPAPRVFANTTDSECRYVVVLARGVRP
jgi:hypothetical protein